MKVLPPRIAQTEIPLPGLELIHRGKVRTSYALPGYPNLMLVVASDRISVFDHILSALVRQKGEILTAMSHFWTCKLQNVCETDFVAAGRDIDDYLPDELRFNPKLQKRATIVGRCNPTDVEDIVRDYLTGSGWKDYQACRTVSGHLLPEGLQDGSQLPELIYTPSTKAVTGHDVALPAADVAARYGAGRGELALKIFRVASDYARQRGIVIADTKFEFSKQPDGSFVLMDEKLTPDSSRFWAMDHWATALAKGTTPPSHDKEFVRTWAKSKGVNKRDPEVEADVEYVNSLDVPASVLRTTTKIYRYIFWRLTGTTIEEYQHEILGIAVPPVRRRIQVIVGSESDLKHVSAGMELLQSKANVQLNVMSCHRNPAELDTFMRSDEILNRTDVVIAGAGLAAALPGIVKSHLCAHDRGDIPVIGVAFRGNTDEETQAAILSIKCLPGQPVELTPLGTAYVGDGGFHEACFAAVNWEFYPKTMAAKKAQMDIKWPPEMEMPKPTPVLAT